MILWPTSNRCKRGRHALRAACVHALLVTTALAEMPDWLAHVTAIAIDEETREVWVGTLGDGLYRCSGGRCDRLDQLNSGLAGNVVFDAAYARGRVWAATNGGLSVFDPIMDQWHLYFARRADEKPTAIIELRVNDPYLEAVTRDGPVYCFHLEDGKWADCGDIETGPAKSKRSGLHWPDDCRISHDERSLPPGAIGVFLSANRSIALPGSTSKPPAVEHRPDLIAVELAVELRPNSLATGPHLVIPTPGYASYGWGLPEDELVGFSRGGEVGGIVADLGDNDAVADGVLARLGLPTVNMADPLAITHDENPWVFRCLGDEPRRCARVLDYLFDDLDLKRLAAVRTPGRDAGRHIDWWADHAEKRGVPLSKVVWNDGRELGHVLTNLREAQPDVVLTWCDPDRASKLLSEMRRADIQAWFVGGPDIVCEKFVKRVGGQEARVLALVDEPPVLGGPLARTFDAKFTERSVEGRMQRRPDARAYRSLLATDHLATALVKAGADRRRVRSELQSMERTVSGERHCENLITRRDFQLARLVDGRWEKVDLTAGVNEP